MMSRVGKTIQLVSDRVAGGGRVVAVAMSGINIISERKSEAHTAVASVEPDLLSFSGTVQHAR